MKRIGLNLKSLRQSVTSCFTGKVGIPCVIKSAKERDGGAPKAPAFPGAGKVFLGRKQAMRKSRGQSLLAPLNRGGVISKIKAGEEQFFTHMDRHASNPVLHEMAGNEAISRVLENPENIAPEDQKHADDFFAALGMDCGAVSPPRIGQEQKKTVFGNFLKNNNMPVEVVQTFTKSLFSTDKNTDWGGHSVQVTNLFNVPVIAAFGEEIYNSANSDDTEKTFSDNTERTLKSLYEIVENIHHNKKENHRACLEKYGFTVLPIPVGGGHQAYAAVKSVGDEQSPRYDLYMIDGDTSLSTDLHSGLVFRGVNGPEIIENCQNFGNVRKIVVKHPLYPRKPFHMNQELNAFCRQTNVRIDLFKGMEPQKRGKYGNCVFHGVFQALKQISPEGAEKIKAYAQKVSENLELYEDLATRHYMVGLSTLERLGCLSGMKNRYHRQV